MSRSFPIRAMLLPLMLAACHHAQPKSDDQRTAEGRILPATVSDAMLPYDTASSQPPAAPRATGDSTTATAPDAADAASADSGAMPDAPPTPAASPLPPASPSP